VINSENGDSPNPNSAVLDHDKGQTCITVVDSSIVGPRDEQNRAESILANCDNDFSKKIPHDSNETNENKCSLQKPTDHSSGTRHFNNVTAYSPVIGRRKLSTGARSFDVTNRWTLKRVREIDESLQQEILCREHMSPLLSSRRSDRKGLFELNTQPEAEMNSKTNNVRLPTVDKDLSPTVGEKELSPPVLSQWNKPSVNNMVSPVMKCDRRWRNRKHRMKVSHLRKNFLNNTNRLDRSSILLSDVGLKKIDAAETICSPNLNVSPSSPVLVKSREKRFRRKKLMMTAKLGDCIDKTEFIDCHEVSSSKDVSLLGDSILVTPQQKHMHSEFNNIHGPVTPRGDGKTEDDSRLRESQHYGSCDAESDSVCTENMKVLNEVEGSESSVVECSIEANITAEKECSETHSKKNINPSLQQIGKVLKEQGHCGRKSENLETKVLFPHFSCNILCGKEYKIPNKSEQKCNIEAKKEIPDDVTSAEAVIETETSLDISVDNAAMCHHSGVPQVNLCFIPLCYS
jgi:hypothetical protein